MLSSSHLLFLRLVNENRIPQATKMSMDETIVLTLVSAFRIPPKKKIGRKRKKRMPKELNHMMFAPGQCMILKRAAKLISIPNTVAIPMVIISLFAETSFTLKTNKMGKNIKLKTVIEITIRKLAPGQCINLKNAPTINKNAVNVPLINMTFFMA